MKFQDLDPSIKVSVASIIFFKLFNIMKKKFNYETIIGIDISKKTLDICLTNNNEPIFQTKIDNTAQGLKSILKKLKSLHIRLEETLFCCENTGIYTSPLLFFAQKHTLNLWVENPLSSSKTCHACGRKQDKMPLSVREWDCSCGLSHDRDINAARVIRKQAIADALGQSVCIKSSSTAIPLSAGAVARG